MKPSRPPNRGSIRRLQSPKSRRRRTWFRRFRWPWRGNGSNSEKPPEPPSEPPSNSEEESTGKKWRRRLWFVFKWSAIASLLCALVSGVVVYRAYQEHIVRNPGEHIDRNHIQSIIFQESPVFYQDGETPLGVLYAQEHREYVAFDDLPEDWIDAITAAEDQRFFEHPGVDIFGIARAMWQNFQAGRVVAGGSTITQQTAKNLYYRPDRSWESKWRELQDALRLEAHFTKNQILEFYANQFHVNSNGRGIGIAARYFFDKEVSELSLIECAYIAGMVKSPATYNPFIGESLEARNAASERAQQRTRYVLERMVLTGAITEQEFEEVVEREIPFHRGTFQYSSNVLIDEVSRRLDQAPFPELFEELGIDNISTAGIRVRTTVNQEVQRETTYALWHHLTEIGPLLEGQTATDLFLGEENAPTDDPFRVPVVHEFRRGRVSSADDSGLTIDLGGHSCLLDIEGVDRMAQVLVRAISGERWRQADTTQREALHDALTPGTVSWFSIRDWDENEERWICDLELRPELQGAAVVLHENRILAMVGGNDNRNYNRALAERQLGSTWKPLLYQAAIEAGWSPADRLDNRSHLFYFENSWYYPQAAHRGEPFVSMAWAGVRSENLASIWLLSHLTERMSSERLLTEAVRLGLLPAADEEFDTSWVRRIRDELGVISTDQWLPELGFNEARLWQVREGDLGWEERLEVQSLFYGDYGGRYERERSRVESSAAGRSRNRMIWALDSNFLRFRDVGAECETRMESLRDFLSQSEDRFHIRPDSQPADGDGPPSEGPSTEVSERMVFALPELPEASLYEGVFYRSGPEGNTQLACGSVGDEWQPLDESFFDDLASGATSAPWTSYSGERGLEFWVDGRIRRSVLVAMELMAVSNETLLGRAGRYSVERLQFHPDFRTQVALHYVRDMAAQLGIEQEIPLILSMPLGAAEVSLLNMSRVYEGMAGGPQMGDSSSSILIAEIRDRDGQILYRAPEGHDGADQERRTAGRLTGDILRNVVRWGTGIRAREAVVVDGATVPLAGKTGTTNDYRNAAFLGFVPVLHGGEWSWARGYTLGVYVGYDDNREMVRGGVRIDGASGALPVWMGTANGLARIGLLGTGEALSTEMVIEDSIGLSRVAVENRSGLPIPEDGDLVHGSRYDPAHGRMSVLVREDDLVLSMPEAAPMTEEEAPIGEDTRMRIVPGSSSSPRTQP